MKAKIKVVGENLVNIRDIFEDYELDGLSSTIPFYNNHDVRFMFVAGSDDQNHDAIRELQYAKRLAEEHGHKGCEFLEYKDMGHDFRLPYDPPGTTYTHMLLPKGVHAEMGGASNTAAHVHAQADVWKKNLDFFKETLN